MGQAARVLVAGGDATTVDIVCRRLSERGHDAMGATTAAHAIQLFRRDGADVVVVNLPLPDSAGSDLVRRLQHTNSRVTLVLTGRDQTVTNAVDAFQLNAFEYLTDPRKQVDGLLAAIGVSLGSRRGDRQLLYLREKEAATAAWGALIGDCPAMREVSRLIKQVCSRSTSNGSPPTILISGENGTGKGLVAKTIHYNGVRRNQAFVDINCAATAPALIENELFGYSEPPGLGIRTTPGGLVATASGGTLFLDEVTAVPLDVQLKLLDLLESGSYKRPGDAQVASVDIQFIAASSANLERKLQRGQLRPELYDRLNVIPIRLPPLRDRGHDKVLLAEAFISSLCREHSLPPRELGEDARRFILDYEWPGNVRELRNQIERALLISDDVVLHDHCFERRGTVSSRTPSSLPMRSGGLMIRLPDEGVALETIEHEVIRQALERCSNNVSQAARFLRISRQTLIYRLKKHGFTPSPPMQSRHPQNIDDPFTRAANAAKEGQTSTEADVEEPAPNAKRPPRTAPQTKPSRRDDLPEASGE